MIRVYWYDCSLLTDEQELQRALPRLDEKRRAKTLRLQTAERRAQSACTGLVLRQLFGEIEIAYTANGKPYIEGSNDTYFSISHSGPNVVCALSDREIGIDLESVTTIRPAVLQRCFTEEEQKWIGNDPERFTRLWTMKEAYMKLTGTGLSVPANKITLTMPPEEGKDAIHGCYWAFPQLPIPCSLCTREQDTVSAFYKNVKDLL